MSGGGGGGGGARIGQSAINYGTFFRVQYPCSLTCRNLDTVLNKALAACPCV